LFLALFIVPLLAAQPAKIIPMRDFFRNPEKLISKFLLTATISLLPSLMNPE
jgi:hypothetical protein